MQQLSALLSCVGSASRGLASSSSYKPRSLHIERLFQKTMSGFLPSNVQFASLGNAGLLGYVPHLAGDKGLLPSQASFLQSQLLQKTAVNPLHCLIQNLAFGNAGFLHPSSASRARNVTNNTSGEAMMSTGTGGGMGMEKLDVQTGNIRASSSHLRSREASPTPLPRRQTTQEKQADHAFQLENKDMYESRGTKRPREPRHSPEKKRARAGDTGGSAQPPDYILRTIQMDPMSNYIWHYYEDRHQSPEVYMRKMRLREALYTLMKGVFPYCGVYVVGSSMNGFGAESSDMDMCLMISQAEIDQKKEATEILRVLLKSLRACNFLREIKLIRAKVPILKFFDRISEIEVDLNINNSVGIRNTHLLRAYSLLDWRVSPLVLFAKHWAKSQQINDASHGTISSYSIVLMVIHFLQNGDNGKPPVLPSLQQMYPHKFSTKIDVRLLTLKEKLPPYTSPNQQSLADLFLGFLQYYASKFDFQNDVISIRLGAKLSKSTVMRQSSLPSQWKFLCIEEPFDYSNTARSVYDLYTFQRIYRVIRLSHSRLQQTGELNSILDSPL